MTRYALITAATSPIGSAIAKQLHARGYELLLHYAHSQKDAKTLAGELNATLLQADFTNKDSIAAFMTSLAAGPKLDVLVNNAGVTIPVDESNLNEWERVLRVNATAPALLMTHAPTFMTSPGVIVNISSIYGHERFGEPELAAYSASKAALNSLTRTFAKKLAPNIRVNAIAPGYVDSNWNKDYTPSNRQRIAKALLTQRLVTPAEVAELATHIVNNGSLNGEVIYLDGGQTVNAS